MQQLIADKSQLTGVYGTVRMGEVFECPDEVAGQLIRRGMAHSATPPKILYAKEKEVRNESHSAEAQQIGPFVTCLCVTRNRRQWLPKAIRYFQAQTYANRELLIIADGEIVEDLIPDDDRIRLLHIEAGRTIGEKRNFGAEHARGEIIAHWDDDDYSAPERLEDQVARLLESGKAVTGYRSMLFTDGRQWWKYDGDLDYAIGTSLCYRKEWWQAHQFPAQQIGEDGEFVTDARIRKQLSSVPADRRMVATIHPGNTSPRQLLTSPWQHLPEFSMEIPT